MILLNFAHPITNHQRGQIESMVGKKISRIYDIPVQFQHDKPYAVQIDMLVGNIELTAQQWQNEPILLRPPSFNFIALSLLAELHGRMGYFPPCLRLRPVEGSLPPEYEIAEIINLQNIRDAARVKRTSEV